jgi:hypothetical protein
METANLSSAAGSEVPLLDVKDEAPPEVKAWQNFADHLHAGKDLEAYMAHIKHGGTSDNFEGASPAAAAAAPGAVDPLADAGNGDLFWDIVKGRVDMTPPPVGDLDYAHSGQGGGGEESMAAGASSAAATPGPMSLAQRQRAALERGQQQQLGMQLAAKGEAGEEPQLAAEYPPQCPMRSSGVAGDECVGSGEGCALCLTGDGYCKPTGGSLSVSKIEGKGALRDYYYLNIMGEVGHPLRVIMRSTDGYGRGGRGRGWSRGSVGLEWCGGREGKNDMRACTGGESTWLVSACFSSHVARAVTSGCSA